MLVGVGNGDGDGVGGSGFCEHLPPWHIPSFPQRVPSGIQLIILPLMVLTSSVHVLGASPSGKAAGLS